jgi:hypothetical protein
MDEAVQRDENLRTYGKPIIFAGTIASVYFDNPVSVRINENTVLSARTNVPDQTGQFAVSSRLVNGAFDLDNRADQDPRLFTPGVVPQDPTVTREKYRFSFSRPLPLDITSGLSYGSSSNALSASVAKPISDHLTCVVDTVRPVDSGDLRNPEERIKLLYGIQF